MEENTDKNTAGLKEPWKKGESGNPNGRPKGRRNFSTIFYDALESLANKNGMEPSALETEIVEKALLSARKGDARFYKDLMDRVHGTAPQVIDHTVVVTKVTDEEQQSLLALLNDRTGT